MGWDAKALIADCDLRELAGYLGMKKKRSGSTTFIECLSGFHTETDTNHCEAKRNGCRCYSCHASYENGSADAENDWNDTISVVRQFRRVYGGDDSFNSACETIAEFLAGAGGMDRYRTNGKAVIVKTFPFSPEELQSAGMATDNASRKAMQELYDRDEVFFKSIVLCKLEETMDKLKKIIDVSENMDITDEAVKMLHDAGRFYERLTGKKQVGRLFR